MKFRLLSKINLISITSKRYMSLSRTLECRGELCHYTDNAIKDSPDFTIIPNFINSEEESCLIKEIDKYWRHVKYEYNHWDNAILGFRETEKQFWKQHENEMVIQRLADKVSSFAKGSELLPHVHILDLAPDGYIKPHIDSVKFCGPALGSISLLSTSVMKLTHHEDSSRSIVCLLPRLSLYIMRGSIRYNYTHEILPGQDSMFMDSIVPRHRRVSIIARAKPLPLQH